jgi:hypothetical protein
LLRKLHYSSLLKVTEKVQKVSILKVRSKLESTNRNWGEIPANYRTWDVVQGIRLENFQEILGFDYCRNKRYDSSFVQLSNGSFARILIFLTNGKEVHALCESFSKVRELMPQYWEVKKADKSIVKSCDIISLMVFVESGDKKTCFASSTLLNPRCY